MTNDRNTLNLAAAVLCGIGGFVAFSAELFSRRRPSWPTLVSALLATVGSTAWAAAAYQDIVEAREAELLATSA